MKKNTKSGVILYYTLIISALLMMFLCVVINDMQKTVFINNKLQCEMKAYWAAMAGLEFAEKNLCENINWSSNPQGGTIGNYKVDIENGGIHGHSTDIDGAQFFINFYKSPPTVPTGGNRALSFNSAATVNPWSIGGKTVNTYFGSDHKVTFPEKANLYIAVEGRCGAFKSVVEKMYIARKLADKYASALYVNSANIDLSGKMIVSDLSARKPCIVSNGNFIISGDPEIMFNKF